MTAGWADPAGWATIRELQEIGGVSKTAAWKWKRGKHPIPHAVAELVRFKLLGAVGPGGGERWRGWYFDSQQRLCCPDMKRMGIWPGELRAYFWLRMQAVEAVECARMFMSGEIGNLRIVGNKVVDTDGTIWFNRNHTLQAEGSIMAKMTDGQFRVAVVHCALTSLQVITAARGVLVDGLSQYEVSKASGVDQGTLSKTCRRLRSVGVEALATLKAQLETVRTLAAVGLVDVDDIEMSVVRRLESLIGRALDANTVKAEERSVP